MSTPEAVALKANTPKEAEVLRTVLARSTEKWNECKCGWFYKGVKCPAKNCPEWKKATGGKKIVQLYAHAEDETYYDEGKKLGLEGEPLRNFSNWGYELAFEGEVDLTTGEVKLLSVDGHKIQY